MNRSVRTGTRGAGAVWLAVGVAVGVWVASAAVASGQPQETMRPRTWAPEVGEALAAYRAGDVAQAHRLCEGLLAREGDGHRDAAVLEALCLLRMPARADRIEGRARLSQLMQEDPALQDEPECKLAYGVAATALSETATALGALEDAAEGFARQGITGRCAAALVALAEAWARHGEWELTPARFGVKRPSDTAEANAIRRAQINALRRRIEALPDQADALDRLDLLVARNLMAAGVEADRGRAILKRLAGAKAMGGVGSEAAMELATEYEAREEWSEALSLYERVQREGRGELSGRAEERVRDITRPQIVIDAPSAVACGQPVPVRVRVRGLTQVQLEVRGVDVEAWLGSGQTRSSEAFLPEVGSVRATRVLDTRSTRTYGWWQSDGLQPGLEFAAEAGAYVVLAKGEGGKTPTGTVKRLVVVSDLTALCCVGPRGVVVWAVRAGDATAGQGSELAAKFWMNRSFAPTEVRLDGDVARFPLPNEARVMREKGWVGLVRSGDHVAICRGRVPGEAERAEFGPHVALVAGPPQPEVGGALHVAGLLLPGVGGGAEPAGDAPLELQVIDTLEKVQYATDIKLTEGGSFAARVPISAEFVGKNLRLLARYRGQALDNILGRTVASVPGTRKAEFRVQADVPSVQPAHQPLLRGVVRAEYPWGTVPVRSEGRCNFRAVHLPKPGTNDEPVQGAGAEIRGTLDQQGGLMFEVPLADLGWAGGPLAIDVDASVSNWEGRTGSDRGETLVGAEAPYAWLTHRPAAPVAGEDVRFRLGWACPGGLAVARSPEIAIRRAGSEVARLPVYPGLEGFTSPAWCPAEPGSYEITTTLAVTDAEPVRVTKVVDVGATPVATRPEHAGPRCTAHFTGQDGKRGVHVRLEGEWAGPMLVLLASDDPLAARSIAALHGVAEFVLPLAQEARAGLRVLVLGARADDVETLCAEQVGPDPQRVLTLSLAAPGSNVWPGTTVAVRADCGVVAGAMQPLTLTARLIHAATAGYVDPRSGQRREAASDLARGLELVSSTRRAVVTTRPTGAEEWAGGDGAPLWALLREGETLWTTSSAVGTDGVKLEVPVPDVPGMYKLVVVMCGPEGEVAADAVILDARRGIRVAVDSPGRLMLGDRSLFAVLVESGYAAPVEAQIRWQAGDALHIETVRVAGTGHVANRAVTQPATVSVPAGGRLWLQADVEAACVGQGRIVAEVATQGLQHRAEGSYEVLAAEVDASSGADVRVRRTVSVWTRVVPETDADEDGRHGHGHGRWRWVPLGAGGRLAAGQFLQVRDEITLSSALPELIWRLRVPATCRAIRRGGQGMEASADSSTGQVDVLEYKLPKPAAGVHAHDWYLAVVRPGACVVPAPELRGGGGAALSVTIDPAETRLVVLEAE